MGQKFHSPTSTTAWMIVPTPRTRHQPEISRSCSNSHATVIWKAITSYRLIWLTMEMRIARTVKTKSLTTPTVMKTAPSRVMTTGMMNPLIPLRFHPSTTAKLTVYSMTMRSRTAPTTGLGWNLAKMKMISPILANVKLMGKIRPGRGSSSTTAWRIATEQPMKTMEPVP